MREYLEVRPLVDNYVQMKSWGRGLHDGISSLIRRKRDPFIIWCALEGCQLWTGKRTVTGTQLCWHLDLGLTSFQNCEEEMLLFISRGWGGGEERPEVSFYTMWEHIKKATMYKPRSGPHQAPNLPGFWSWTSRFPELWETCLFLRHLVYGILLRQSKVIKTVTFTGIMNTAVICYMHSKLKEVLS